MALCFAIEIEQDINRSVFWWVCNNDRYCQSWDTCLIPATAYDWAYW